MPVYEIVMEPEDTSDRTVHLIDNSGEPEVTEETAGDAFDTVLSRNEGYVLKSFRKVDDDELTDEERRDAYRVD